MDDGKAADQPRRRCLVLGGSGALGSAVCERLAMEGARVAFTYHEGRERAEALLSRLPEAIAIRADAVKVAEIEEAVARAATALDGLDALIHCIGIGVAVECEGERARHRMPEIDEASWDRLISVNLKSAFFACRSACEVMRRNGGGNIVLIGSIEAVKPVPAPVHYAASKGGLSIMAQSMAKEVGEARIRVNVVAPGVLEGGLARLLPDNLIDEYKKHCGLKRVGRLPEAAGLVAWLALHNTYISGRTITLDGGL